MACPTLVVARSGGCRPVGRTKEENKCSTQGHQNLKKYIHHTQIKQEDLIPENEELIDS